jgi:Subtilase family
MVRKIIIVLFSLLVWGAPAATAQTALECQAIPGLCPKQTVKPKLNFNFDLNLDAMPKILKPATKVHAPKKVKSIQPKSIAIKKPEPIRVQKITPAPFKKPEPKPFIAKNSWDGLREVPVTKLEPADFVDIAGHYIIDLDPAAFIAAGLDLRTISEADLAARLGIATEQLRSIQRRFLFSAVLQATPKQAASLKANPLVSAVYADTQIKAAGGTLPLSWGLDRLDSPSLPIDGHFDRDFGDYDSRIYLFDTGVDGAHIEFDDRVKFGSSFVAEPTDASIKCREHGTEMASLIAGQAAGSAPKAEVVDLVVLPCGRNKTGEASSLIEAAEWLLIREADFGDGKPAIANMSLAGKWSRKINQAVSVLTENGVAVVVAAGNNSQDACRFSPASAKDAVTVAATGPQDETPSFSNFGTCVDINAPGRLLTALTEGKDDDYVAVNGTSGSAALVSGLLARSLKIKGPKAASQWLADAAVPAQFWRKDQSDLSLAQASPKWRIQCPAVSGNGVTLCHALK